MRCKVLFWFWFLRERRSTNFYFLFTTDFDNCYRLECKQTAICVRYQESGHLRQPAAEVQSIAMLIHHVANYLPEGTSEYELAISLVDLVQSMS
jgi:hypothetical protein